MGAVQVLVAALALINTLHAAAEGASNNLNSPGAPSSSLMQSKLGLPIQSAQSPTGPSTTTVTPLVVGGSDAPSNRFTHHLGVLLGLPNGEVRLCGASLVREDVALTSAYCIKDMVYRPGNIVVVAGAKQTYWGRNWGGGAAYNVRQAVVHPGYSEGVRGDTKYDLGLLFLEECAAINGRVQIVKMATDEEFAAVRSSTLLATGWGKTSGGAGAPYASSLQFALARYLDNETCTTMLPYPVDAASVLCAAGEVSIGNASEPHQGMCKGDSGGPLIMNVGNPSSPQDGDQGQDRLVGVTSWSEARNEGCGAAGQNGTARPAAYARVTNLRPWVEGQIDASPKPCGSSGSASYYMASDTENWAGRPSKLLRLKPSVAGSRPAAVQACQQACADREASAPGGCIAFSVSVRAGRSRDVMFCGLFAMPMPIGLCGDSASGSLCSPAHSTAGSYRLRYTG